MTVDETLFPLTDRWSMRLQRAGFPWPAMPLAAVICVLAAWAAIVLSAAIGIATSPRQEDAIRGLVVLAAFLLVTFRMIRRDLVRFQQHREELNLSGDPAAHQRWVEIASRNRRQQSGERQSALITLISMTLVFSGMAALMRDSSIAWYLAIIVAVLALGGGHLLDLFFSAAPPAPPQRQSQAAPLPSS